VKIQQLRKLGYTLRKIARELCRAPSTISRELKRNEQFKGTRYYYDHHAQMKANGRRRRSYRKPYLKSKKIQSFVVKKIQEGWTPEQVAGYMKLHDWELRVSHEAIYQWIYRRKRELRAYLPWGRKRRYPRGHSKRHKISHIKQVTPLSERPEHINDRSEYGHWECDLAISQQSKAALLVGVERRSRYTFIRLIKDRTADTTSKALIAALSKMPASLRKTITYDNGHENVQHMKVNKRLGTYSYFCDPYAPWQKGTVENTIGIIRRIFPKKTDFSQLNSMKIRAVQDKLNNRPRKVLNYLNPNHLMNNQCVALHC
jgi:IS30 family transposase